MSQKTFIDKIKNLKEFKDLFILIFFLGNLFYQSIIIKEIRKIATEVVSLKYDRRVYYLEFLAKNEFKFKLEKQVKKIEDKSKDLKESDIYDVRNACLKLSQAKEDIQEIYDYDGNIKGNCKIVEDYYSQLVIEKGKTFDINTNSQPESSKRRGVALQYTYVNSKKAILKALDDGNGFPKKINVELEIPIKL